MPDATYGQHLDGFSLTDLPKSQPLTPLKSHKTEGFGTTPEPGADAGGDRLHAVVRPRMCQRSHAHSLSHLLVSPILRDIPVLPTHERRPPVLHGGRVHVLPCWDILDQCPPHDLAHGH